MDANSILASLNNLKIDEIKVWMLNTRILVKLNIIYKNERKKYSQTCVKSASKSKH